MATAAYFGLNVQIGNEAEGIGSQSGNGNGGMVGINTQIGNTTDGDFSLSGNGNGGLFGFDAQIDNYVRW